MNDTTTAWLRLGAFEGDNDLDGALSMADDPDIGHDPRYIRVVAWLYGGRGDYSSAGRWYARALQLGSIEAEAEFLICLQQLFGHCDQAAAEDLASASPEHIRAAVARVMRHLYFGKGEEAGLCKWTIEAARCGGQDDSLYAGELLLSIGDQGGAYHHFARAAREGSAMASQALGEMYFRGVGVPCNAASAARAYRVAADNGYLLSQSRLAHMEHKERGRRVDLKFLARMVSIMARAACLRLMHPKDPRLYGLP